MAQTFDQALLTTTVADAYQVAAGEVTDFVEVSITNFDSQPREANVWMLPSGGSQSDEYLIWRRTLEAHQTHTFKGIFSLKPGARIRWSANQDNAVRGSVSVRTIQETDFDASGSKAVAPQYAPAALTQVADVDPNKQARRVEVVIRNDDSQARWFALYGVPPSTTPAAQHKWLDADGLFKLAPGETQAFTFYPFMVVGWSLHVQAEVASQVSYVLSLIASDV